MFTRKTIPFIVGSILLVAVAFLFLTDELDWTYVSDLYKDEPAVVVVPEEEPVQNVKLEVAVNLDAQQYDELISLAEQVHESYPQLDVRITNYIEEGLSYEDWETRARLGELGDIQLVQNEWVVPLAIQGLYQPVDRLMNNDVLSDQLPGIVDALKWNGYIWAVPYETNPYLLFVHQQAAAMLEDGEPAATDPPQQAQNSTGQQQESSSEANEAANEADVGDSSESEANQASYLLNWGFKQWLERYEQADDFAGPLLNIDPEQLTSALVWLALWHNAKDEPMKLAELSEQQLEMLHYLTEHTANIEPSLKLSESESAAQRPFLYLTTAKNYFSQRALIEQNYEQKLLIAPLPWMNGKSFMLSASTSAGVKAEAAMQWLEVVNRFQPQDTIIHRKQYSAYSSDSVQIKLGTQLQQKLLNRQLFEVDPKWVIRYEQLQQQWKKASSIEQKLGIFQQ